METYTRQMLTVLVLTVFAIGITIYAYENERWLALVLSSPSVALGLTILVKNIIKNN